MMENGNTLSWAQYALDQSAVPVLWIDAAGKIIYANNTAGNFFNQLNHFLTESNIQEILHDEFTAQSWELQWEQVKKCKYFRRSIATKLYESWFAEMHFITARESDFIELRMIANEISAKDERIGEEENNPYAVIFNNSFHFMARLTPEGRILEVNQTGLAFLGEKSNEILGHKIWELKCFDYYASSKLLLEEGMQQVTCEQFVRFEIALQKADATEAHIDFSAKTVINSLGETEFLLAEARDITAYKEVENELKRSENLYKKLAQDIPNAIILQFDKKLNYTLLEGQAL
ncbi:MAG: PAS domain S-box protein, partial [Sphingobacteriales bacterium]